MVRYQSAAVAANATSGNANGENPWKGVHVPVGGENMVGHDEWGARTTSDVWVGGGEALHCVSQGPGTVAQMKPHGNG